MIRNVRSLLAIICALFLVGPAFGQSTISYSAIASIYGQDFNSLPSTGTFTYVGVGPFDLSGAPTSASGMPGWYLTKIAGNGTNAIFRVDDGSNISGGGYSYGTAGATERALGSLASGTTVSAFGAVFVNDTGAALNSFTLSYTGEQWRHGSTSTPNTLSFSYGIGNTDIATGTFAPATSLNFVAPNVTTAGALDGNAAGNNVPVSATITGFTWNPGQRLVIRWTDVDDIGNDDGLGIDNLSFRASQATTRNLIWTPPPIVWNGTNQNWTVAGAGATNFQGVTDVVNFTDSGLGAGSNVNIDPNGVTPAQVNVSNTTGNYVFSGGPIGGSASLTKTGAGTLTLSGTNNTYTGATNLNAGVVVADSDHNLGDPTSLLNFNGGTLKVDPNSGAGLTIARAVNVDLGGANLDTSAQVLTFTSASFQGIGPINIFGNGTVVQGAPNLFGNASGPITLSGDGTRLKLGTGNNIAAGSRVTISSGATIDDTGGDGESFSSLAGSGTYLGVNAPTNNFGLALTAPGVFDGRITAGVNGAPGATPDQRRLNLNITFNTAGGTFTLTNPTSDFAGSVFVGNGTLSTPLLPFIGQPSPLGIGTDGVTALPILLGGATAQGTLQYTGPTAESDRVFLLGTNANGGAIDVADPNTALTLSGVISGTGSGVGSAGLTKVGPGTLILNAANTYTGGTIVNAGTLIVNTTGVGNSGTGPGDVVVNAGRLGGSGNIAGSVTINAGVLNPGTSPGILTVGGAITMSANATLEMELNGTVPGSGGHDQIRLGGQLLLNSPGFSPTSTSGALGGQTLSIILFGSIAGEFNSLPEGSQLLVPSTGLPPATPFYLATISYGMLVPGAVTLQFAATPVPEPVHALLLGVGVLGIWRLRRKA